MRAGALGGGQRRHTAETPLVATRGARREPRSGDTGQRTRDGRRHPRHLHAPPSHLRWRPGEVFFPAINNSPGSQYIMSLETEKSMLLRNPRRPAGRGFASQNLCATSMHSYAEAPHRAFIGQLGETAARAPSATFLP
eukprot:1842954-Pleurochrysis_carterae.AAC.1